MEDEERYAVASVSGTSGALHVWLRSDGASRRNQSNCRPPSSAAVGAALHRGHLFLASASASGTSSTLCAHALHRASGGPVSRSAAPEPQLVAVAVAPGSGLVVAGGKSGRCYMWSLVSGDLLASWDAHFRSVLRVVFSDDEATVVTSGADASVLAFDVAELVDVTREMSSVVKPRLSLHGHDLPVTALAIGFGGASARLVTGSNDRNVKAWHLSSGQCIGAVAMGSAVVDIALASDESRAFVGLASGSVAIVETLRLAQGVVASADNLARLEVPAATGVVAPAVTCISVSPLSTEVVVGYANGFVRIFDVATSVQLMVYSKHGDAPVTWVGVLSPVPDAVLRDVGGGGLRGEDAGEDLHRDGGSAGNGHARSAVPDTLLFEGALKKAVDPEVETKFLPRLVLGGTNSASDVWTAIDRAVELAP
jgi:pre-rRNA-processing protein IPI3